MTQNFGSCGKCGKIMEIYYYAVYPVTFNGKVVCTDCTNYLRNLHNQTGELNPNRESQQEYLGVDKKYDR